MKTSIPRIITALALTAALPALHAGDANKPTKKEERKELRVIVGKDGEAGHPGARIERRVFVHPGGGGGEKEVVTFLGIETSPVSPTLTAQLGLPNGSGLVVAHVVPDSPAAGALRLHDILLKLDDQILVETRQLSVLIRNHKEGDEVALTYLRGGKQAVAKVKLGKHEVPKMGALFEHALPGGPGHVMGFGAVAGPGRFEAPLPGGDGRREEVDRVLSLIQRAPAGGPPRMQIERKAGPGFRAMSINTGNSSLNFSDEQGSLDLTLKDGRKTLVAKDAKGGELFSGPVTTPEERQAMPAGVRERLEKLEGMHDITFRTDGDFQGAETRVFRPAGRGISMPPTPLPPPRAPAFL